MSAESPTPPNHPLCDDAVLGDLRRELPGLDIRIGLGGNVIIRDPPSNVTRVLRPALRPLPNYWAVSVLVDGLPEHTTSEEEWPLRLVWLVKKQLRERQVDALIEQIRVGLDARDIPSVGWYKAQRGSRCDVLVTGVNQGLNLNSPTLQADIQSVLEAVDAHARSAVDTASNLLLSAITTTRRGASVLSRLSEFCDVLRDRLELSCEDRDRLEYHGIYAEDLGQLVEATVIAAEVAAQARVVARRALLALVDRGVSAESLAAEFKAIGTTEAVAREIENGPQLTEEQQAELIKAIRGYCEMLAPVVKP